MRYKIHYIFLFLQIIFLPLTTHGQEQINKNEQDIIRLNKNLNQLRDEFDQEVKKNANLNDFQEEKISNNIRWDTLVQDLKILKNNNEINSFKPKINSLQDSIIEHSSKLNLIITNTGFNKNHMNRFWMLLSAMLVFFMQAGFKVFEVGLVRKLDRSSVGIKNLLDWLIVTAIFLVGGFGFMFGKSNGWIGTSLFFLEGMDEINPDTIGYEFFLFQLAFAATAVTIISGALAIRTHLISYVIIALIVGLIVYPIFGHWVWGNLFIKSNLPKLKQIGFLDFAGSTVVHSVGAWVALTGMWFIRHRTGKAINENNVVEIVPDKLNNFKPHNLGYSVLGVLILWFGWWGFNGGSTSFLISNATTNSYENTQVPLILINTNLAAVFAGLTAFFHSYIFKRNQLYEKTLGGTLGGLVAITACCNVVTIPIACLIGFLAGLIHNVSFEFLNTKPLFGKIIDDPVGAIPVHGACGVLGTLCVALGDKDLIKLNFLSTDYYLKLFDVFWINQLVIQFIGVLVCGLFTVFVSIIIFSILKNTLGLEISRAWEDKGWIYNQSKD